MFCRSTWATWPRWLGPLMIRYHTLPGGRAKAVQMGLAWFTVPAWSS